MKILAIGDIVSRVGRNMVFEVLELLRPKVDFVVANAENAAHGRGMTKPVYEELLKSGIDVFTMGNHTWGCPDIAKVMRYNDNVIRPANFEGNVPGEGTTLLTADNGVRVGVINLIGRTYMTPAQNPFLKADECIESLKDKADIILVDFHAEATSEKIAMGYYLDGRVTAVFGTHTHVQTADETVLTGGTGYITDLGMTGPEYSVLGMEKKTVVDKFIDGMPRKFEPANGRGQFSGCIFDVDEKTGKTLSCERILIK